MSFDDALPLAASHHRARTAIGLALLATFSAMAIGTHLLCPLLCLHGTHATVSSFMPGPICGQAPAP
ncbi:hypothetical protein KHC28_09495 [Ancylobacter sonchi]|uniref:hypothetical protein n=1 Tax=Ancylobacter sonchi TaxID=1937790 RepID=UPI001BD55447|nr:hypothetical protein [Ancylobacter sonchi]MBS7533890.1 hypothetical protein [Ancylobacter sonchi]